MAKLFIRKRYVADASYHIFNRGNNKSPIFFAEPDYWAFRRAARKAIKRVEGNVDIRVFSLMPNHYHLLIYQRTERAISTFMRSLVCTYSKYMNAKYQRDGTLFCGTYCARLLENERDVAATRKYILANPLEAGYLSWKHVGTEI